MTPKLEGKPLQRLCVHFGGRLVPLLGRVSWEDKLLRLDNPSIPFSENGRYEAILPDPTYRYTLMRVTMKPLKTEERPSGDPASTILFEFFHRKKKN